MTGLAVDTRGLTWQQRGACNGSGTPDAWFPHPGQAAWAAVQTCGGCPVRERCLEYALTQEHGRSIHGRWGIWGGLHPGERADIDARRRIREAARR